MPDSKLEMGRASLARIDPAAASGLQHAFDDVCPDLGRLVLEYAWGDVYSRPGLDLKMREIATIAALVAKGGLEPQLKSHIGYALKAGCSREEVVEVMVHMTVFAGFPNAIAGALAARAVFADIDAAGPP